MNDKGVVLIRNAIVGVACGFTAGMLFDRASLHVILTHAEGLRYTNAQIEMVFLCGILGLGIGFPVASLQRHIRPYYINLIACLGSITGFLLLWTATLYNGWFWDKAGVLAMYNFLAGHSIGYAYYTSLWVGMSSFPTVKNVFSWIHHLPLVCSALLLWMIVTNLRHLLMIQVIVVMVASFISIVLLRTPARVEAPVRVTGDARQFTLPAYEYPASDTESIADSDDSGVGEDRARMIPGSMNRWRRIMDAFYESRPILITFALATSTSMNLAHEPVRRLFPTLACCLELLDPPLISRSVCKALPIVNAEARFVVCAVGATVGLFVTYLPGISRINFLLVVLAGRAVFLTIGVAQHNAPEVSILLYCSGGFVESVFWTVTPVMIYGIRGRKRLTLLWSCAILCYAIVTALQSGLILLLFNTQSSFAVCKEDKCPLLVTELRLALIMCAIISTFWQREYQPEDRNSSNS